MLDLIDILMLWLLFCGVVSNVLMLVIGFYWMLGLLS